jgi:hypothetical protein
MKNIFLIKTFESLQFSFVNLSKQKAMWTCPRCGAQFVQKNLWHSCGIFSVDDLLKGRPEPVKKLFWYFIDEFKSFGPVILHPTKTRVALMVQVRFASINRINKTALHCHLWLKRKPDSKKFYRIDILSRNDFVCHFKLEDENFIDMEFRKYMKQAYENGKRPEKK